MTAHITPPGVPVAGRTTRWAGSADPVTADQNDVVRATSAASTSSDALTQKTTRRR